MTCCGSGEQLGYSLLSLLLSAQRAESVEQQQLYDYLLLSALPHILLCYTAVTESLRSAACNTYAAATWYCIVSRNGHMPDKRQEHKNTLS